MAFCSFVSLTIFPPLEIWVGSEGIKLRVWEYCRGQKTIFGQFCCHKITQWSSLLWQGFIGDVQIYIQIRRSSLRCSQPNLMQLWALDSNTNSRIGTIWLRKHCKGSDGQNLTFRKSELICSIAGALVAWQKLYHGQEALICSSGWPFLFSDHIFF